MNKEKEVKAYLAGELLPEERMKYEIAEEMGLLDQVLNEISAALERGDTVKLSSFGTFSVRQKKMRIGRNPKTGVEVPITPRRILSFRPSQILKKQVNAKK